MTSKIQKQEIKAVTPSMRLAAGKPSSGSLMMKKSASPTPSRHPMNCCTFQSPQQQNRSDSTSNMTGIVAACLSSRSSVGSVLARCSCMFEPARWSEVPALDRKVPARDNPGSLDSWLSSLQRQVDEAVLLTAPQPPLQPSRGLTGEASSSPFPTAGFPPSSVLPSNTGPAFVGRSSATSRSLTTSTSSAHAAATGVTTIAAEAMGKRDEGGDRQLWQQN
mmetsp:Transcript_80356/g.167352  ORF Transcript_80356/g.167352 Transcript_80356/m.167352 type:complete len:220 (-) Transcript_80356:49-708(-)